MSNKFYRHIYLNWDLMNIHIFKNLLLLFFFKLNMSTIFLRQKLMRIITYIYINIERQSTVNSRTEMKNKIIKEWRISVFFYLKLPVTTKQH